MASTLNEILLKAPALLQTVEDAKENDQSVPNMLLVQSNQLLHTCELVGPINLITVLLLLIFYY